MVGIRSNFDNAVFKHYLDTLTLLHPNQSQGVYYLVFGALISLWHCYSGLLEGYVIKVVCFCQAAVSQIHQPQLRIKMKVTIFTIIFINKSHINKCLIWIIFKFKWMWSHRFNKTNITLSFIRLLEFLKVNQSPWISHSNQVKVRRVVILFMWSLFLVK